MHVHLCDFCGEKIDQPAAVLTLAPEPPPGDPTDSRSGYHVLQAVRALSQPLRHLEFCVGCLRHLLAIRAHVEAVRPPRPAVGGEWGSDVLSRMFKDPT